MGSVVSSSAARMRGPSPPWWMSEPFSIIHRAMASRVSLGGTRHAAFGDPRERPVLAVAERSAVELRVARHEALDLLQVVGVDGQLELPGELQRFDVRLELGPAREAVLPGDLELRLRERLGLAGLEQVFGLVLEMAEVGVLGELARGFFGVAGHGNLLSVGARCPHDGPKEGSCGYAASRWASTLSADRVRPVREGGLYRGGGGGINPGPTHQRSVVARTLRTN